MNDLLAWLGQYSLPVVLLIAIGAAVLYFAKMLIEKSITQQFSRYGKALDLQLQRRSNFEERVLLERFTMVRQIQGKIDSVFTNIRRMHHGTEVDGLIRDGDVVPLTEIFELLVSNRYLISRTLYTILDREAQLALKYAGSNDPLLYDGVAAGLQTLREEFDARMNDEFGLARIRAFD